LINRGGCANIQNVRTPKPLCLSVMSGRGRGAPAGVVNYIEDAPQARNPAGRQERWQALGFA